MLNRVAFHFEVEQTQKTGNKKAAKLINEFKVLEA
jgi:hypothetical protein